MYAHHLLCAVLPLFKVPYVLGWCCRPGGLCDVCFLPFWTSLWLTKQRLESLWILILSVRTCTQVRALAMSNFFPRERHGILSVALAWGLVTEGVWCLRPDLQEHGVPFDIHWLWGVHKHFVEWRQGHSHSVGSLLMNMMITGDPLAWKAITKKKKEKNCDVKRK